MFGDKGSWDLWNNESSTQHVAVTSCLSRCSKCSRCNFISVSVKEHDCSWFYSCDLDRLQNEVEGFFSGKMPEPRAAFVLASTPPVDAVAPGEHFGRRCAEGAPGGSEAPTYTLRAWSGGRTGFAFNALVNAMHIAACCAGIMRVSAPPRSAGAVAGAKGGPARSWLSAPSDGTTSCVDFSHLPRVSTQRCAGLAAESREYFFSTPYASGCPSNFYYRASRRAPRNLRASCPLARARNSRSPRAPGRAVQPAVLPCYPATQLPSYPATQLPSYPATLLPCYPAALLPLVGAVQPAVHAAAAVGGFEPQRCRSDLDETLVAHVRSGDIFKQRKDLRWGEDGVHVTAV